MLESPVGPRYEALCSKTGKAFILQSKNTFAGVKCTKRLFLLLHINNLESGEESKKLGMWQGTCVAPIPAFFRIKKEVNCVHGCAHGVVCMARQQIPKEHHAFGEMQPSFALRYEGSWCSWSWLQNGP